MGKSFGQRTTNLVVFMEITRCYEQRSWWWKGQAVSGFRCGEGPLRVWTRWRCYGREQQSARRLEYASWTWF